MLSRYRTHLLIGLLAFACAQGWNRWNTAAMRASSFAYDHVSAGGTVMAVDDASYLQGVEQMLEERYEEGPLTRRPELRPPGYSLWYLLPRSVLAKSDALAALALLQCLLYALSVMIIWETLLAHRIVGVMRWALVIAFAVLPLFHGFLFYTLTEGVTPSLALIILCCALLSAERGSTRWLITGTVLWSFLLITRPALGWVGLALVPAAWERWRSVVPVMLLFASALAPLGLWWARNVMRAGHLVGLHPVHRVDEPGINRPTHAAFWELAKSWGASGDAFHQAMEPPFRAAMRCDTSGTYADDFVALAPAGMLTTDQAHATRDAYRRWQRFNCTQLAPALRSEAGTVPITTREEQAIILSLQGVTDEWRSAHLLHHHVIVPLRVLRKMVAHSNLNLHLFQHTLRGRWWMEALRWLCAAVHIALLACAVLAAFMHTPAPVRWCAAGACFYLFYLAYAQRGVEERYTVPVLFIGVACAAFVAQRFFKPNFATDSVQP